MIVHVFMIVDYTKGFIGFEMSSVKIDDFNAIIFYKSRDYVIFRLVSPIILIILELPYAIQKKQFMHGQIASI